MPSTAVRSRGKTTRTRVQLTYVVGSGRSGSTLLSRLLEQEGFLAIGETRLLSDPLSRDLPCGCGELPESCPVWGPIFSRLAENEGEQAWRSAMWGKHRLRSFVAPTKPSAEFQHVLETVRDVYATLAADGRPIVDESKTAWLGYLLAIQPWADVRFIEIVRSPRDVIDSWSKDKDWLAHRTREDAAKLWLNRCAASNAVRLRVKSPWLRRPFSQLVNEPDRCLTEILGREQTALRREGSGWSFESPSTHIFRSNPDKMRTGTVALRPTEVRPAEPAAGAGPIEKLACQYWNTRLAGKAPLTRAW